MNLDFLCLGERHKKLTYGNNVKIDKSVFFIFNRNYVFITESYDHCHCILKILNILPVDTAITFFLYLLNQRKLHFPESYMTYECLLLRWSVSNI